MQNTVVTFSVNLNRANRRRNNAKANTRRQTVTEYKGFRERNSSDLRKQAGRAKFADRIISGDDVEREFTKTAPVLPARELEERGFINRSSRKGLEILTETAQQYYNSTTPHHLPWNLFKCGPAIGFSNRGSFEDPGHEVLKAYARFAGWLVRAADSRDARPIRWFIAKTTSYRGQNSPHTYLSVWELAKTFSSPEAASRKLCAVRQRANQILSSYGVSVSNAALAGVMMKFRATGKAARIAAMVTLRELLARRFGVEANLQGWKVFFVARGMAEAMKESQTIQKWAGSRIQAGEFTSLREAMNARARLWEDTTDGVKLRLDPVTTVSTRRGITVTLGFTSVTDSRGRQHVTKKFLVRNEERNYHSEFRSGWQWDARQQRTRVMHPVTAAIRQAIDAWKLQDEVAGWVSQEFSLPANVCPLIYKADSIAVGNCRAGTEAFMAEIGVSASTQFVGAHLLLQHLTRYNVRSTFAFAARQLNQLMKAAQ